MKKLVVVLFILSIQREGTNDGRFRLAVKAFSIFRDIESTTVDPIILDSRAKEVKDIMLYLGLKNNQPVKDLKKNVVVEKHKNNLVKHQQQPKIQNLSRNQFIKQNDIINITLDPAAQSENVVYSDNSKSNNTKVMKTTPEPGIQNVKLKTKLNKDSSQQKIITIELNRRFQNVTIGANNATVVSDIETVDKATHANNQLSAKTLTTPKNSQNEEKYVHSMATTDGQVRDKKKFKDQDVQVKVDANYGNNPEIPKYKNKFVLNKLERSTFAVQDYTEIYQKNHDYETEYFPLSNIKKSRVPVAKEPKAKKANEIQNIIKNLLGLHRNNDDEEDFTYAINKPEKSEIKQRIVLKKNFNPKNIKYHVTAKPIEESDLIIDGSLSEGLNVNSNEDFEMPKDELDENDTHESSEEAQYDDDIKFKRIWNSLGKNPNSLLNEFSNLILNYINNRTPKVAPPPVRLPESDIDEMYVIQEQEKNNDPIKESRSRRKPTTVSPTKVALNNILIEMRQMVETEDKSLKNYNWLSSVINIQVGVKKILKLCGSADVSDRDWYLLLFTERLFDVARSRVPKKIRSKRLDQTCRYFAEILKQLRPMHRAMDKISAQKTVNRKEMFEGLKKDYLMVPTKERLLTVVLHSAVNRILEQIDLKLEDARESDTLNLLLAGKPRDDDKIKITSLKKGSSKKKKYKSIRQQINIAETCADLIQDMVFVYRILHELVLKNRQ